MIVAIGIAVAERDMHHRAGQRRVGAGPQRQMHVGHRRGAGAVRIDHHQLRAALLPRARDMRHHVDLGGHRVAAPHHDQVGARHLARVRPDEAADAGHPASLADRRADRLGLARIAHDVAQPVDAVALHQPHRAGVVDTARPPRRHAASAVVDERLRHAIQRLVPGDRPELAGALGAGAQQRLRQPVRMVDAFGVARDLGADHAGGVAVGLRAAHRADARCRPALRSQGRRWKGSHAGRRSCGCHVAWAGA